MLTARSLTVSRRILCTPPTTMHAHPLATMHTPNNHACPLATMHPTPWQPCTPPTTMHAPWQPCTPPSNHACPPDNHACPHTTTHAPLATMHAPQQPCMPPGNHTCPPATTHAPPATMHAPLATTHPPDNHTCPPATTYTSPQQPRMPPLWTEWQTGVKILPCPKLRLGAVIIEGINLGTFFGCSILAVCDKKWQTYCSYLCAFYRNIKLIVENIVSMVTVPLIGRQMMCLQFTVVETETDKNSLYRIQLRDVNFHWVL